MSDLQNGVPRTVQGIEHLSVRRGGGRGAAVGGAGLAAGAAVGAFIATAGRKAKRQHHRRTEHGKPHQDLLHERTTLSCIQ